MQSLQVCIADDLGVAQVTDVARYEGASKGRIATLVILNVTIRRKVKEEHWTTKMSGDGINDDVSPPKGRTEFRSHNSLLPTHHRVGILRDLATRAASST